MTDVSGVTNASTTQSSSSASSTETTVNVGEQFSSFIQLLTAQIQNQDPLSPLDSTQFVDQLATFSSLEQQVNTNTNLESIATMISDMHGMLASQWLGQTVTVESSWVPFSSEAVDYMVDIPDGVDQAILTVRDTDGNTVWSESLDPGAESYTWDGTLSDGTQATANIYQMGISLFQDGVNIGTVAPRIVTKVTDVASENGTMKIGTTSNLTTDIENVQKVDS